MRYLVAVSGGVDSVVLLHKLVGEGSHDLVVAHFDHGIRPESDADSRFVEGLAKHYGVPYEATREELGAQASEATARTRRYAYLRKMAKKHNATIVTAHHCDDLIETIAINLIRGTGWRGLAVLGNPTIVRPLLTYSKNDIYTYALLYQLEWVEDETNATGAYLRNRVRRQLKTTITPAVSGTLIELWRHQHQLKQAILAEERPLFKNESSYSRYFFTHIDITVAEELLRFLTRQAITRPQAVRALQAIKTAQPGSVCEVGGHVRLQFGLRDFTIQTP